MMQFSHLENRSPVQVCHGVKLVNAERGQDIRVGQKRHQHPVVRDVGKCSQVKRSSSIFVSYKNGKDFDVIVQFTKMTQPFLYG